MHIEESLKYMDVRLARRKDIRQKKSLDYASEEDAHGNLKAIAAVQSALADHGMGIRLDTPSGAALWHLLHKLIRILNIVNKGAGPLCESLEETFDDLENYSQIALECVTEECKQAAAMHNELFEAARP